MRVLLPLTTVLALAVVGCGAGATGPTGPTNATDVTAVPTAVEAPPTAEPTEVAPEPAPEPTEPDGGTPIEGAVGTATGDCAASGLDPRLGAADLPEATRATAEVLLDAATRCDEQLVTTAATESGTTFSFGASTVGEVFALPEAAGEDPAAWEALARLLGATSPTIGEDGLYAWPAAHGAEADEADWQELVGSGLYTTAEVEELRGAEGYLGWRVGIDADGTWLFMTAGD